MDTPANINPNDQREEFEKTIYIEYLSRCGLGFRPISAHVVFKKSSAGNDYEREDISAMWFAWKLARGIKS